MSRLTLRLTDPDASSLALAGSKGATLAAMRADGHPVPDGFVVSTELFTQVVSRLPAVRALLRTDASSGPALHRAAETARRAVLSATVPRTAASRIRAAHRKLRGSAVSVRSSATAEDLEGASFAGQYDSFLNVKPRDLVRRVIDVWASFFTPHAVAYRRRHGISDADAAMAVVVQKQLLPDAAGVLFTRDPISGRNRFVVTAAIGLGEGVVSGAVPVDRFELQPRTGKRLAAEVASKHSRVAPNRGGGIETVDVDTRTAARPSLSAAQLRSLAACGRKLVKRFGGPQDVEFAFTGKTLHVLQSRPMTAIELAEVPEEPWDEGLDRRFTWQLRTGPFCRLEEEYMRENFKGRRKCWNEVGSSMTRDCIAHFANGRIYTRPEKTSKKELERRHAAQNKRVFRYLNRGTSYFEGAQRAVIERRLAKLRKQKAGARSLADRVRYLEAAIKHAGFVQGNMHWRMGPASGRSDWKKLFHELTGDPPDDAHVLTLGVENHMTRLIARLRELARIAQDDAVLRPILLERRFDELETSKVSRRAAARRFKKRFDRMMAVYGIRAGHGYGTNSGWYTPTWNMNPHLPLEIIATYVEQDLDAIEERERQARTRRDEALRGYRSALASEPDKRARFEEGLRDAVMWVRFLEDHNYYMEQLSVGTMREAVHFVGSALAERDLIEKPDDVSHFSLAELKALARKKNPEDQRDHVEWRKKELDRRRRMKPPRTLGRKPKQAKASQSRKPKRGKHGNTLYGERASGGRVTGRAVVLRSRTDRPRVHPGDILVASNVGPDWTPTFAVIGGLVLDSGSLMQHAALVAREYRIPAVMNTLEASKVIANHQTITVDGDHSLVELAP